MKTRRSLPSRKKDEPEVNQPTTSPKPGPSGRKMGATQRKSMPAVPVAGTSKAKPAASGRKSLIGQRKISLVKQIPVMQRETQQDFLSGFNLIPAQQAKQIIQERNIKLAAAQVMRQTLQSLPLVRNLSGDMKGSSYTDILRQNLMRFPFGNGMSGGQLGMPFNKLLPSSSRMSGVSIFQKSQGRNTHRNEAMPGPSRASGIEFRKPLVHGDIIVLDDSDDETSMKPPVQSNGHMRKSLGNYMPPKPIVSNGTKPMAAVKPTTSRKSVNIPIINNAPKKSSKKTQPGSTSRPSIFQRNGRGSQYVTSSREVELIPLPSEQKRCSSGSSSAVEESPAICEVLPIVNEPMIPDEQNPFPREIRPALLSGRLGEIREHGWIQRALMEEEARDRMRDQMMMNCFDMHFSYAKMFTDLANMQLQRCFQELQRQSDTSDSSD